MRETHCVGECVKLTGWENGRECLGIDFLVVAIALCVCVCVCVLSLIHI